MDDNLIKPTTPKPEEPAGVPEAPTLQQPSIPPSGTDLPGVTSPAMATVSTTPVMPQAVPAMSPTPAPTPVTAPQAMQPLGKSKKKYALAIPVIALVLLLGGSAGAYFGLVVPNKPENVWKTALSNTGKGYDRLATYLEEQQTKKGSTAKGTYKIESGELVFDGSFETKSDQKDSVTKLDIGAAGVRVNLDVLTTIPENSTYPDVYMKASGLDGLSRVESLADYANLLTTLNDQWYSVDHTLFEQLEKSAANTNDDVNPSFTTEDIAKIQQAVGRAAKEYVFTSDTSKSVLEIAQYVGKETVDGRSVHHYKVKVNKANMKAFVTKLKDELKQTKLADLYSGQSFEEAINFDGLLKSVDELKDDDTMDVWVDAKTKLVRTVRFSEKTNQANYLDIGMKYTGGDDFPFYLSYRTDESGDKTAFDLTLSLNTKTDIMNFEGILKAEGSSPADGTVKGDITLHNDDFTAEVPVGAKPYTDLINELFGDFYSMPSDDFSQDATYDALLQDSMLQFESDF